MADRTNNQMNDLLGLNQSVLSNMGTSGTGGFMGGQQARPEPVDRFPALGKESFGAKDQPVLMSRWSLCLGERTLSLVRVLKYQLK
jgi:hypothetical protein